MSGEKSTTFGEFRRAAASLACGLIIAGLAALFFASGVPPFNWLSIVPGLLALLLFYNSLHSLLASQTPPTTLKLDLKSLRPSQSTDVIIRQPGPVRLHSLRANLICERITKEFPNTTRSITYPCQLNFFDSGPFRIPEAATKDFKAELTIPPDAEPSLESLELIIRWRIEVWGKVVWRADFMRPFDIEVV
ncbi:hypothetical protein BH09VER1_BH09VER1_04240 [soil metagenome]